MITDFRLTVFITVARTLSFTRAAAMLNVSQPAISKHIKELECDFGEPLFNRKGSSISLTQKGRDIVPSVEAVLDSYRVLGDMINCEESRYEGLLRIGASTTIAQYILPAVLAQFNHQYPHIHLSVINANSDEVLRLLQNKEIDVALIEGDNIYNSVHYTSFAKDRIVLVSTNRLKQDLTLEELEQIPLIIREEGSGTLSVILSALKSCGISRRKLNVKMQLGSSEAILRYVKRSKDYAFVSVLAAREHVERGELVINNVEGLDITRDFRFVTLHGQSGRLIELFCDFCARHYNF